MRRFAWLVCALLAVLALPPVSAQTPDRRACLEGAARDLAAACTRLIEEMGRSIDFARTDKIAPKDRVRHLYQSHNLRGGAYQAMARRQAANGEAQRAAELHLRAIEDFDAALRLDPAQPHAFLNRGSSWAELVLLDRAIQDFEQALRIEPGSALALNNRGSAYGDKGDFDRAIADLARALELNPKYADALVNRGGIYLQKRDYDRAIADLSAALRAGARDVYVLAARGRAWRDKGDDKRAKLDFEAALAAPAVDQRSKVVQEAVRELLGALKEKAEREGAAERERAERERAERQRAERERIELQEAERQRAEGERAEKAARAEAEKAVRERAALEKAAAEKAARQQAAREKAEREQAARERAELEKAVREKAAREKVEIERAEREKAARERIEQAVRAKEERIARERAEREKAEQARAEGEKAARDQARAGRVALVIGNSAYPQNLGALDNPRNDARALAKAFDALNFTVLAGIDLDQAQTADMLARFKRAAREAETAVFFFAGHGMQHNEVNYLAPIDADTGDLGTFTSLQTVMADLGSQRGVRILIIDACRSRPDAEPAGGANRTAGRSLVLARGLARPETRDFSGRLYVAFAAQPGQEASDGVRLNSPFTGALLKHLLTPGLELRQLFIRVRAEVVADTDNKQRPESWDSLDEAFVFKAVK